MHEWIQQVLNSDQAGLSVLIAVFLLGIISVFTCACNLSIIGIVAAYSGTLGSTGKTKTIVMNALFFLLGLVISMSAVGGLIGYASEFISASFGNYWKIAAGLVSVFFGLYMMDLVPFKLPSITLKSSNRKSGMLSSILFGLTIGGLTLASSACCNPVFPIVLAISFVKGSFVWGILLMLAFALGHGITLTALIIGAGLGFGKTSKTFSTFGKVLKYGGGAIMVAIGFYFLITI